MGAGNNSKHHQKQDSLRKIRLSGPLEFLIVFAVVAVISFLLVTVFRQQVFDFLVSFMSPQ